MQSVTEVGKTAKDYENLNVSNKGLFRRFARYYRPYKTTFFFDMLCSFLLAVTGLLYPILSRYTLNTFIPNGMLKELLIACAALLGVYFLRAFFKYCINYYGHVMGVNMQANMRTELFAHLEGLPYSFYDNNETGQLMTRMTNDLFDVAELAHHGPENIFITSFMTVGAFVYLCTINWKLSLIVFAFLPLMFIIAWRSRKQMTRAFQKSREEIGGINATLENSIAGIRVTKAYANGEHEQERFERNNQGYVKARGKAYKAMGIFAANMGFVSEIYNVVVLVAGGLFCIYDKNNFDYADLVAFMISINLFISPIQTLIAFFEQLQDGITGFKRFAAIMDVPVEKDDDDAKELTNPKGDLRFENVTFAYNEKRDILKNVSFEIPAGKTYAFVGASGGGKTTICHLIPKFYQLNDGMIYVDETPISKITSTSLRQSIGIVQQDVFLFTGTFKENISYGKMNATDEEIIEAAKRANIHDYIVSLPDGYDTQIGERGIKLSGGQKQRLSIARVFLKNPSILILDEATSALDNTTEALIQRSLFDLCKGRTTLIVAHRLSTIRSADRIFVIDRGEIKEQGTHEELMAKSGIYKSLYDSQFADLSSLIPVDTVNIG
ncbi:MAG: ABC transporter ATP-binding protein [Clostridia bacterium]|nr:ABC transporter ATP-binding protein [Clostridia bacterium]